MLLLLFGAAVDYSLLFINRYKEYLRIVESAEKAFIFALDTSCGTIAVSAATTAAGLATLCLARFGVFRDVGPAIVLALVTAGIASITLVPALVAIVGPALFWPRREGRRDHAFEVPRDERLWTSLADLVTRRPGLVLILTVAILAGPMLRGVTLSWSYDAHSSLPARYSASRGMDFVRHHWSVGEISQTRVLIASPISHSMLEWIAISKNIVASLRKKAGLYDIRGLTSPLGLREGQLANIAAGLMGGKEIASEFVSPDRRAIWFSATLDSAPQSPEALACLDQIRETIEQTLRSSAFPAQAHFTGATAETADLRDVTQSDFHRVSILSLLIIFLIVSALLRDVPLSIFMVAATVVGYLATLGVTAWVFRLLTGSELDWEVEVFLFIVMVAVGQDYNLFFAVRMSQESQSMDVATATSRALIHTGGVISSCGVIMAATLGSMIVGEIKMLQQLGFALGLGMLIDTFIVRPLLLPTFIVLTQRTISKAAGFLHPAVDWRAHRAPLPNDQHRA
jgi:RND superfamily putative drug exporter